MKFVFRYQSKRGKTGYSTIYAGSLDKATEQMSARSHLVWFGLYNPPKQSVTTKPTKPKL